MVEEAANHADNVVRAFQKGLCEASERVPLVLFTPLTAENSKVAAARRLWPISFRSGGGRGFDNDRGYGGRNSGRFSDRGYGGGGGGGQRNGGGFDGPQDDYQSGGGRGYNQRCVPLFESMSIYTYDFFVFIEVSIHSQCAETMATARPSELYLHLIMY